MEIKERLKADIQEFTKQAETLKQQYHQVHGAIFALQKQLKELEKEEDEQPEVNPHMKDKANCS